MRRVRIPERREQRGIVIKWERERRKDERKYIKLYNKSRSCACCVVRLEDCMRTAKGTREWFLWLGLVREYGGWS